MRALIARALEISFKKWACSFTPGTLKAKTPISKDQICVCMTNLTLVIGTDGNDERVIGELEKLAFKGLRRSTTENCRRCRRHLNRLMRTILGCQNGCYYTLQRLAVEVLKEFMNLLKAVQTGSYRPI